MEPIDQSTGGKPETRGSREHGNITGLHHKLAAGIFLNLGRIPGHKTGCKEVQKVNIFTFGVEPDTWRPCMRKTCMVPCTEATSNLQFLGLCSEFLRVSINACELFDKLFLAIEPSA